MALLGQFRRDTLENWSTINPMLADGEFIIVRDNTNTYTIGYKTGNGYSRFNDLGYNSNVTFLNELGDNEQAGISQKFTGQIINDYNISNLHTNEIAADPAFGTNKFTLSQAIAVIPASVLKQGLVITFISSETNEWKRYQNVGTPFTTLQNWEDLASSVNVIQPPGDLDVNDYLYNIYYAPITGKVTYEPSRLTTDFIQVDNGQIIDYTIYGYTSSIAIAAFDANQNIILNKCVITSSLTGETGRYIVDSDNIRFLRFTRLNNVTGLNQAVSFYKPDYLPNIEESTKGIRQFSESDFIVEGMYINPVTGKDVANASWNATDFIPVVGGELIFNKNLYGTTGGAVIAFYDGAKVPVELIRGNTAYDANFVSVPEGALYVRFSMATGMPITIKIINGTNRTQMLSEDKGEIIVDGFDKFYVTGTWSRSGKDLTVTGGSFTQARYDTPTFEDEFVMSCRVRSTVATGGGFETGIGKTSPTAGYVDRWIMMCKDSTGSYLKSYYRPNGSFAEQTGVRQKLATELVLNKWYVLQLIKTTDEKSAITGRLYDEETGELLASFRTTAAPYAWGYPVAINRTGQAQFSGFVMSYPKKSYPLVAVYGDSFIEGNSIEATKNLRYSALLQSVLGKYQCLLFGHGGATSLSDDSRTLLQIEKVNSAYAIIAYGDNDVDFNTWYKYVAYMIQMCELTNTLPVFVTVCPRVSQSAAYVAKMQAINNWIRTSGYPYIDANEACTSDGLTWKTGYVLDDGQHPSVLGHQAIFNKIKSDCGFLVENAEAYDTGFQEEYVTEYNVSSLHVNETTNLPYFTLEEAIQLVPDNLEKEGLRVSFLAENGELQTYVYGGGGLKNVFAWYKNLTETVSEITTLPTLEEGGVNSVTGLDDDSLIGTRVRSAHISSPLIKSILISEDSNIQCRILNIADNAVVWYDNYDINKHGRQISQYFRLSFRKKDNSTITVDEVLAAAEISYCEYKYIDEKTQSKINERVYNSVEEFKISKDDPQISSYITDANGVILGSLQKDGSLGFTSGGFAGEKNYTIPSNSEIIKVLTDANDTVIGHIDNKGKVTIFNLEAKNSSSEAVERLLSITGFLANGIDNHKIVDDKIYTLLKLNPGTYEKAGVSIPTVPTIVIHDDDTIDNQIPESGVRGADETTRPTTTTQGGYASILWPLIKAINVKYGSTINATDNKIICGLAAEGQRTGLTKLYGQNDEFTGSLNSNGKIVKKLVEHEGWDVMCHSMTARYIEQNYWVEGLNSDFAIDVRVNGVWNGDLHWNTTTCYDTVTKKNYQIKQDKTGWTELPKAYIKPYCAVSREANSTLLINPTYSVKYQVETWFNRADIAGLPYLKKVGVNWGNSHSIWHMRESLKYADRFFARSTESNIVPCDTNLHRFGYAPSAARNGVTNNTESYNVYTEVEYARMTNAIDRCIATNGLLVLFSHVNAPECSNFYYSYFTYPTERTDDRLNYRDDNYNPEWTVPLQYDELMSMDENNYWEVPPARLGIANWGEWYPCPGTTMALLYDSIRYAISKGVRFATSAEANESFGNLVSIGIRNDQATFWDADSRLGDIEEENRSYCTIGADGSINYKS